jgi:transcriptional regulator with XRE-family HTH domain
MVAARMADVAEAKKGRPETKPERPYPAIGAFVRRIRESRGLKQGDVARQAGIRQPQITHLEKGGNVAVEYYDRVARVLGFRGALDMFMSGGDPQTRKLLRFWRSLSDDEARNDALELLRDQIVREEELPATASSASTAEKKPGSGRIRR